MHRYIHFRQKYLFLKKADDPILFLNLDISIPNTDICIKWLNSQTIIEDDGMQKYLYLYLKQEHLHLYLNVDISLKIQISLIFKIPVCKERPLCIQNADISI